MGGMGFLSSQMSHPFNKGKKTKTPSKEVSSKYTKEEVFAQKKIQIPFVRAKGTCIT
jgi:hypothetical protein